ncbi:HTH-type transcriptional activator RhaR [Emticicia aquatica]|jgi:AraC family transcriptional activator of pobA|uniref:HTH-type transcriptional activator RhaR n=1 Tax=Emticicia aquatica TaxID=1681835 RepID=A0ABN8ENG9_9BACT|nr:helix-turn-helix domain-containing protein [Emticicia aquatica]CAH0994397.1 HTH-type transcriptional activator RhaR [Emticicia aquatica]
MNRNLVNFKGLYGDNHQAFLSEFIHHETLEVRSKLYDWEITEHLHTDLIQIFIFSSGEGLLISEHKKIALNAPSILVIPTNTLHGFVFQSNICGDVITFTESFLENIFRNSPHILLELNHLKSFTFEPNREDFDEIQQINSQIIKEISGQNFEKQLYLQSLFQLLFLKLYRIGMQDNIQISKSDNRTLAYFQSFQKNIKKSLHESKSMHDYAKELNITAVHLNRICQTLVKKSALQIVHEYLIGEAKKYLKNTTHSIAEISYFLDFKDPAYFTRLFKKQTGFSPSEFRKK